MRYLLIEDCYSIIRSGEEVTPSLEEADRLKTLCVLDKLLRPPAVAGGKAQGAFSIHEVRSTGLHGH